MLAATWHQIVAAKISGIGPVAAVQLAASFAFSRRYIQAPSVNFDQLIETSDDAVALVRRELTGSKQEQTFAIYLNTQRLSFCKPVEIAKGTANATFLHPRDIFAKALSLGAVSLIVVHTHPSGDATPSEDDIRETARLIDAGNMMGIPLDDHIVIGCGTALYVSIRGLGSTVLGQRVLSNPNMVDYAAVRSDECPNRTARPERPFPDGPAAARLN